MQRNRINRIKASATVPRIKCLVLAGWMLLDTHRTSITITESQKQHQKHIFDVIMLSYATALRYIVSTYIEIAAFYLHMYVV